ISASSFVRGVMLPDCSTAVRMGYVRRHVGVWRKPVTPRMKLPRGRDMRACRRLSVTPMPSTRNGWRVQRWSENKNRIRVSNRIGQLSNSSNFQNKNNGKIREDKPDRLVRVLRRRAGRECAGEQQHGQSKHAHLAFLHMRFLGHGVASAV